MNGHDATSVVGQIAGLGDERRREAITPEQLIQRFVTDDQVSGKRKEQRDAEGRFTRYGGFCGYIGGRGPSMVVGFDDGYSFMGDLVDRGWKPLPAKGDWPFVVYLTWRRTSDDDSLAIVEYCEGDFTLWLFDDKAAAKALYASLRDCP